jgi:ATP-dependent 26S proteasome regulatory subunit
LEFEPPLIAGVIIKEDPINSGRYIVLTSTGIIAILIASKKLKEKLELGMYIALNQRTFAIMDVLNLKEEDVINAAKKLASHTIFRERD